jgi:hypothetical protein
MTKTWAEAHHGPVPPGQKLCAGKELCEEQSRDLHQLVHLQHKETTVKEDAHQHPARRFGVA